MFKLDGFEEVLQQLKLGEVVYILNPQATYFAYHEEIIHAHNEHSRYRLGLVEFQSIFHEEVFYLKKTEEDNGLDELKDQEYYAWRHKSQ